MFPQAREKQRSIILNPKLRRGTFATSTGDEFAHPIRTLARIVQWPLEVLCVVPRVVSTKLEPLARDNSIVGDTQEDIDRGLLVRVEHLVDIEPLEVFDDIPRVRVPVRHPPVGLDAVDERAACVLQGNG